MLLIALVSCHRGIFSFTVKEWTGRERQKIIGTIAYMLLGSITQRDFDFIYHYRTWLFPLLLNLIVQQMDFHDVHRNGFSVNFHNTFLRPFYSRWLEPRGEKWQLKIFKIKRLKKLSKILKSFHPLGIKSSTCSIVNAIIIKTKNTTGINGLQTPSSSPKTRKNIVCSSRASSKGNNLPLNLNYKIFKSHFRGLVEL